MERRRKDGEESEKERRSKWIGERRRNEGEEDIGMGTIRWSEMGRVCGGNARTSFKEDR